MFDFFKKKTTPFNVVTPKDVYIEKKKKPSHPPQKRTSFFSFSRQPNIVTPEDRVTLASRLYPKKKPYEQTVWM